MEGEKEVAQENKEKVIFVSLGRRPNIEEDVLLQDFRKPMVGQGSLRGYCQWATHGRTGTFLMDYSSQVTHAVTEEDE